MKKFLINFSYDGSDFHGWQVQKNTRTIQGVMENAAEQIFKSKVTIMASGRTDSGVHAINQFAHFSAKTRMKPINVQKALNSNLPKTIFIKKCELAAENFHSRFDAKQRYYFYKITKQYSPFSRNYAVFFPNKKIYLDKLNRAAKYLLGEHNFEVFAKDTSHLNHCNCEIYSAEWKQDEENYYFSISANRFLHNMVRRIVGTLIKISDADLSDNFIESILTTQDHSSLGNTAPAHGLYLENVKY
ncbi:MAG: tRNA pseudouridine(38-40) synthase TruA [Candidatus Cloacimonadota bacterium]|nr:tRNA pseudouridine(38-40) synthase TruA [Candidatus Cloacimonadota bacterium]